MASEDNSKLLATLGSHVRSEQKDDELFERIARGEATDEEIALIEKDEALKLRLDASRPFDEAAIDRIAAKTAKTKPAEATNAKSAKVLRPNFGRRVMTIAGPLAIAAALVLYITTSRGPLGSSGPDLPSYSINATSEQEMRGPAAEASPRLHLGKGKDARFEVVLRPATAPVGKVVAFAFAANESGMEPLDANIAVAAEGSVRITGASRALDGVRDLRIVIGAPEAIGKFDDALDLAKEKGDGNAHVRVLTVSIDR